MDAREHLEALIWNEFIADQKNYLVPVIIKKWADIIPPDLFLIGLVPAHLRSRFEEMLKTESGREDYISFICNQPYGSYRILRYEEGKDREIINEIYELYSKFGADLTKIYKLVTEKINIFEPMECTFTKTFQKITWDLWRVENEDDMDVIIYFAEHPKPECHWICVQDYDDLELHQKIPYQYIWIPESWPNVDVCENLILNTENNVIRTLCSKKQCHWYPSLQTNKDIRGTIDLTLPLKIQAIISLLEPKVFYETGQINPDIRLEDLEDLDKKPFIDIIKIVDSWRHE